MSKLTEAAFYCYLWKDVDHAEDECKFGDVWIEVGEDPETECKNRIRGSLNVYKSRFDDGKIQLVEFWDVSEIAKDFNCFKKHGKIDTKIGNVIGFRKSGAADIYNLPAEEFALRVNKFLKSQNQQLPVCSLSQSQFTQALEVIQKLEEGKRTFLMELCARFGKTIWAGVLVNETEIPLTIICSYVLTSFTSFENDLNRFQQFKDLVTVDTKDPEYKSKIDDALSAGKQVVAFISLCGSSKRQERLDFVFSKDNKRLVIVDEPDFGAHREKQALPIINGRKDDDIVVLMTGTNADRAASLWKIDHYSCVTYPELLIQKRETEQLISNLI